MKRFVPMMFKTVVFISEAKEQHRRGTSREIFVYKTQEVLYTASTMSNVAKLLKAVRKASGYAHFHVWEPATDHGKDNPNFPFKPQFMKSHPDRGPMAIRADHWDGGLSDWDQALKDGRVGHVFDFYITKVGDELITNIEVWIKSETEAVWSDCGGPEHTVKI